MFVRQWLSVSRFQWDSVVRPNNWLTLVFCVLLLIITLLFITFRRRMVLVFRALFSQRHFSIMQREVKVLEDRASLFVFLFDLLAITAGLVMFAVAYIPKAMSRLPFMASVGIFFVLLSVAYLVSFFGNKLYFTLFGKGKEHTAINYYKFVVMTDLAVALFPLLVVIQYTGFRAIFYGVVAVMAFLFAVWFYRLMKINPQGIPRFHFFVYFCTLEILPWLLFLKVLLII